VPDVFPQSPQTVAVEFSIHRLSWWNKFLMDDAFNVKLLPHFHVEGRQERSSSSTDIHPFLKRLNHSQVCVWPRALSPNASVSNLCVSEVVLASMKQNLMQIRCSFTSGRYDRKTAVTRRHKRKKQTRLHSRTPLGREVHKSVYLAIPSGTQLYYKRFPHGIPISGTFGYYLARTCRPALTGEHPTKSPNSSATRQRIPCPLYCVVLVFITAFTKLWNNPEAVQDPTLFLRHNLILS
jgi:hypothetical protein